MVALIAASIRGSNAGRTLKSMPIAPAILGTAAQRTRDVVSGIRSSGAARVILLTIKNVFAKNRELLVIAPSVMSVGGLLHEGSRHHGGDALVKLIAHETAASPSPNAERKKPNDPCQNRAQ